MNRDVPRGERRGGRRSMRDDASHADVASVLTFVEQHSQWAMLLLFVLLTLESFGLPVPGETALIACSVLASQGSLSIVWVIVVGVAAAIIGDNLGYWAARKGGRPLLERHRLTRGYAEKYLPRGERFFARHGGKAVFLGRFVAVLRVTAAWIAGYFAHALVAVLPLERGGRDRLGDLRLADLVLPRRRCRERVQPIRPLRGGRCDPALRDRVPDREAS